jgi:hypothetical protein
MSKIVLTALFALLFPIAAFAQQTITVPPGPARPSGPAVKDGAAAAQGTPGLSAYQTWLALGNTGTEAQFIASLKGPKGDTGPAGPAGSGGGSGGGLTKPTTKAGWQSAVQAGFDNCYIVQLDPTTNVTITGTIVLTAKDCGGKPHGLNGNGSTLASTDSSGNDIVKLTTNAPNRATVFGNLHISGGLYAGQISGNCLTIQAAANLPIYKGTFRDLFVENCGKNGINIIGDVFESLFDNINAGNNRLDGVFISNGPGNAGIISNLMFLAPNLSRNSGYGMHLGSVNGNTPPGSVDIKLGSFINNAKGGILAENGIRLVDSINCENSGLICVDVPRSAFMTRLVGNNAASQGTLFALGGVPMRYTFRYHGPPGNLMLMKGHDPNVGDNYMTYYGTGTDNTAVRAP